MKGEVSSLNTESIAQVSKPKFGTLFFFSANSFISTVATQWDVPRPRPRQLPQRPMMMKGISRGSLHSMQNG